MGTLSIWHWLIVLVILIIFFGRGRISAVLGDLGQGLGNLKRQLKD